MNEDKTVLPDDRPLILLIGSGYREYREYLLRMVSRAARVWLLLDRPPTWEADYIVGASLVDTLDADAMIAVARSLRDVEPIAGLLCWDEVRMMQSAAVGRALGLPGGDPEVIGRCRDKHQTRTALSLAEVPQANSALVRDLSEACAAAARIGYPVVVKPRALAASFGVSIVHTERDIDEAWAVARGAKDDGVPYLDPGVLVEEYLDGPEISVDAACVGGELSILCVARKRLGFAPYFEEVGHEVSADDPLLADPTVLNVLRRAHHAVGFRNGMTHTELRLTASGPKIIEINCRLGGDFIPYLGYLARGIDPGAVAVRVARGLAPAVRPSRHRHAAIHFFYPDKDVVVGSVQVDRDAMPAAVDRVVVIATPGQQLILEPASRIMTRYACAIVVDDTAEACAAASATACRAIRLRSSGGAEARATLVQPARALA